MVLATTAKMITITTKETMRTATTIVSVCAMKESWKAFSVSVSVSASELRNSRSIAWLISAAREPSAMPTTKTPTCSARRGYLSLISSFRRSQWK